MSRCSLRLDDGLLDRSLPRSSASFSIGGGGIWRNTRSLKSRHSQPHSVSCTDSLLMHTPRKLSGQSLHNSSVHSVASDASLLSSLLAESSIQDSTLVDTLWGLDHDGDPKESTIAEQSNIMADGALTGSDGCCPKHPVQTLNRVYCKDCEYASMYRATSKYTCSSPSLMRQGPLENEEPQTSTIYYGNRKSQTGKKVGEAFRGLKKRWRPTTTSVLLSWFLLRLFVVLLPLLVLLFCLCLFGPAGLQSVLPVVNLSDWRTVVSVPSLSAVFSDSQSAEDSVAFRDVQLLNSQPPPTETLMTEEEKRTAGDESARLVHLERSLATLWEQVEAGGQRAEQRHQKLLKLYTNLEQQQLTSVPSDGEGLKPWLSTLLDQQLSQLRTRLDEEGERREQTRLQDLMQEQSQTSRLDQLELQLQKLVAKTEKMEWLQEALATVSPSSTFPAAVSVGVDSRSHDALLAEVAHLEEALEELRQDVKVLNGLQNSCQHLDRIQQTVSAQVSNQVHEAVQTLIYGNQLTVGGGSSRDDAGFPESLLQWLSLQYVSGTDLQAALASLELSILQNISLQLEQWYTEEPVREFVLDTAAVAGTSVTQEDVHTIVRNALRLFSQDRTGLADYALESGGGSILSTRCSETYETKSALLSLFGVPLWYFSQSPRAVIQPDVHPGNCWAFRGSTGFLVIRLSMQIVPTAFSLEHIPKTLTPSGTLLSAPRDFSVYGLDDENQETGKLLGTYTYEEDGEALQTYAVTEKNDQAFQIIEVQVLSNWGHEEYTCMYRFRVHGMPSNS